MNANPAPAETAFADKPDRALTSTDASHAPGAPGLPDGITSEADAGPRLYYRAMAHFYFGLSRGNKTIVADET